MDHNVMLPVADRGSLERLLRTNVVPLGMTGLPVLLDFDEPDTKAEWYFAPGAKSIDGLLLKYVSFGDSALLFVSASGNLTDAARALLVDVIKRTPSGRIFYEPMHREIVAAVLRVGERSVQKTVGLTVYRISPQDTSTSPGAPTVSCAVLPHTACEAAKALYRTDDKNVFSEAHFLSHTYFGAHDKVGRLIGVCCAYGSSTLLDAALIGGFVTHPDLRNRGVAKALAKLFCEFLFQTYGTVSLHVEMSNAAAHRAYKAVGFTSCGGLEQINF